MSINEHLNDGWDTFSSLLVDDENDDENDDEIDD